MKALLSISRTMHNYKMVLAYDGTDYLGWQKTRMGKSIEETLENVLRRILQEEISLQAASRTDRGVHADGQVVNFTTKRQEVAPSRLLKSLRSLLPRSIAIHSLERVPLSFHPTLDCTAKEYHYLICNAPIQSPFFRDFSWHIPSPLLLEEMHKASEPLLGKHDFSAFCNERLLWTRSRECQIFELKISPIGDHRIQLSMIGDHFLYKMVRNIVGTLVYVGLGKLSWQLLAPILTSQDRCQAGVTAPAHGLTLKRVFY